MPCLYCHNNAGNSWTANIPTESTCMGCHLVTSAPDSVTVSVPPGTPDPADAAPFRVPVRDGRADIREIPWLRTGDSTGLSALRLEYPALAPVTTRPLLLGFIGSRLWLVSAALNGQSMDEGHRAVEARRGGWVEGTITFRCSVSAGTASVLLVAVPTWGDRTRNFIVLQAVLPDAYDAEITRRVRVPAPTSAGRYRLVFALAEETAGGYVASGTNWLVGSPRWRDGNDIADWSDAQIAQANREGRTRAQWLYLTGIGAELERSGGVSEASLARGRALAGRHYGRAVIPATAIDVVVR